MQPCPQLWRRGCSGDRDQAKTGDGKGAGESEPQECPGGLEVITLGGDEGLADPSSC